MLRVAAGVVVLVSACGDHTAGNHPDAPATDAPVDVSIDAPADAPSGPASRVWIDGDYLTDGASVAGSFSDAASLPVMPPALASSLGTACRFPYLRFSATATKIAFAANPSDPTQPELYVADVDGQHPLRLRSTLPGIEVACVALSPDGTKVAYTMDSASQNDMYDVYVIDTTGGGVPVQVSPGYPMDGAIRQGWFSQLTWSADSRYLGFTGEFTIGINAYVTDTSGASPTTVALFSDAEQPYTASRLLFDASDHVYIRQFLPAATVVLYIADPDGQNRHVLATPMRSDGTTAMVGATNISPDGATIVFASDAPTKDTFELFVSPTAAWNPVAITAASAAGTGYPAGYEPRFSPDGTSVIAVANAGTFAVQRTKLDGSATSRLVQLVTGQVTSFLSDWTLDGRGIYIGADLTGSGHASLYRLDTQRVDQTPELAVAPPASGDVDNALILPM